MKVLQQRSGSMCDELSPFNQVSSKCDESMIKATFFTDFFVALCFHLQSLKEIKYKNA